VGGWGVAVGGRGVKVKDWGVTVGDWGVTVGVVQGYGICWTNRGGAGLGWTLPLASGRKRIRRQVKGGE